MKKSILVLLMTIFSVSAYAQHSDMDDHAPSKEEEKAMLEKMREHLSLTDAQVLQIQAIHDKYDGQRSDLREQMKKLKDEHRAMRKKMRAEVEQVLTPEQQNKIKEMRAKRQHKKGKGPRGMKRKKHNHAD